MLFCMKVKTGLFLALLLALLTLFSCAGRINGALAADGSASLTITMSLAAQMSAVIRKLTAISGAVRENAPILDGPAIAQSMTRAPGIASVSFKNTAPAAIEGTVRISKIGEFLAAGNNARFILFEQGSGGGRCVITLNRETGPYILNSLSPEISDYLDVLMAPLVTGEELTKTEYLELVSTLYSKAISDEIAGSTIRAAIDFPGAVTSVAGGAYSGKRASFDIPLLDLLVLETPLRFEVVWK